METASTKAPASKRLSLHSLPPRQSLPTWLLVDHAFSSFYLKSSSICWVCPTSPSLKVGDVDVSVSTPSHRLAPAARSEAHTTRDTGWLWRILALFFILLFIINVYSASLQLHFFFVLFIMLCTASELLRQFQDDSRNQKIHCCLSVKARWQCFWDAIGLALISFFF